MKALQPKNGHVPELYDLYQNRDCLEPFAEPLIYFKPHR